MFEKPTWIYVLACAHGKYYVGRTTTKNRIQMHYDGNGSAWTKLHKPYKTLLIITGDKFDEDKYVFKYMAEYGIQNVRGGCFSQVVLPDDKIKMIETILTGVDDRCFNCGEPGHFINDCPELSNENESEEPNHFINDCPELSNQNESKEDESEGIWSLLRSMYKHFKQECFPPKTNFAPKTNNYIFPPKLTIMFN